MMKHLIVDKFYFDLPEDFEGTLGDAFKLCGEYLNTPTPKLSDPKDDWDETPKKVIAAFWQTKKDGGKCIGKISVQKVIDGKCVNQPQKLEFS